MIKFKNKISTIKSRLCCLFFMSLGASVSVLNAQEIENALLWKIEKEGNIGTSYLLGTNNLVNNDFLDKLKGFKKAFKNADVLLSEVLMGQSAIQNITKDAIMPHLTIDSLIKGDDYIDVAAYFQFKTGMNLQQFNRVKPIAIYLILNSIENTEAGINVGSSGTSMPMNNYLQNKAKETEKMFVALESIQMQIDMLYEQFTLERQAEMLINMVKNKEMNQTHNKQMVECYKKQNLNCLYDLMLKSEFTEVENGQMLAERSKSWLPQLMKIIDGRSTFVAVGALHLTGENGLINLLKEQGYKLTPIR